MIVFSNFFTKSTLASFLVLSTFLSTCDLAAGKRKREEEKGVNPIPAKQQCLENEDQGQVSYFDLLPDEVTLGIFSHLDIEDMGTVRGTCQAWNDLGQDDLLLNHLTLKAITGFKYRVMSSDEDYRWYKVTPLESHREFLFERFNKSFKWDVQTNETNSNYFEEFNNISEKLKFINRRRTADRPAFLRFIYNSLNGDTSLEDILQRKVRKTKDPRSLMLNTPNTKKPINILPGLIHELYKSIQPALALKDFTQLFHSKQNFKLHIEGLNPDGSLVFGRIEFPNPAAYNRGEWKSHTFAYNHLLQNIFVSQELPGVPELHSISSDGLTLIGNISPPRSQAQIQPEFLLRWSLQKDTDGYLISENCDVLPAKHEDTNRIIRAASPNMRIISVMNYSSENKGEGALWGDKNHVYSLQQLLTHRANANFNAFFQNGGALEQAQHVSVHENKLIFVGTGSLPGAIQNQRINLIWHASFNSQAFARIIKELSEKAENK